MRAAIALIAFVTVLRVIVLVASPLQLHPDEAQYWWWSHSPDWGYFSKPPLMAWIIHIATMLFGDSEWAVRIASPVLHGVTAFVICAIGRRVYDPRTGCFAALAYLTAPGVSYSAWLMSTDVPLLLCWALALYAFLRAMQEPGCRWTILCGVAVGVGLLAKYAMLYFFLGLATAAVAVVRERKAVFALRAALILPIAALVAAPNIWWNAIHGFPSILHAVHNAGWAHARYSAACLLAFLLGQFGVFGPLLMAGFLAAVFRILRDRRRSEDEIILAAVSVPPVVLMLLQAFLVSANANWAAPAYVGASPLAVRELLRWARGRALGASFAIDGVAMVLLWAALIRPELADAAGLGNAFKREEGWRALAAEVRKAATRVGYDAVAADNRSVIAELLYYARPLRAPLRALRNGQIPGDHFQMTIPLLPGQSHVLVVTEPGQAPATLAQFDSKRALAAVAIPVGGRGTRLTELYDARGFHGYAIPPAAPER
jgi:4-amino-4-deoxy-L-arabinose transferase-like glycosyltransferase